MNRRRFGAVAAYLALLCGSTGAAVLALNGQEPNPGLPNLEVPDPVLGRVDQTREIATGEGLLELTWEPGYPVVSSALGGTVTTVDVRAGDALTPCRALYSVAGRSAFGYEAATPLYREIDATTQGPDVAVLRQILNDCFGEGPRPHRSAEEVDAGLLRSIQRVNSRLGTSATDRFTLENVVWMGVPGVARTVAEVRLTPAVMVAPGEEILLTRSRLTSARVSLPEVSLTIAPVAYRFTSAGSTIDLTVAGEVDGTRLQGLPEEWHDLESVVGSITALLGTPTAVVAASALVFDSAGGACVIASGAGPRQYEPIRVEILGSASGGVAIALPPEDLVPPEDLAVDEVVVNPQASLPDADCPEP